MPSKYGGTEVSQEELLANLQPETGSRYGGQPVDMNTFEPPPQVEGEPLPEVQSQQPKESGIWDILSSPKAMGQMALTAGTAAVSEPIAGLAGIAGAVLPGETDQSAKWIESTRQALTYSPSDPRAQEGLQAVGETLEKAVDLPGVKQVVEAPQKMGDYAYKRAYEETGNEKIAGFIGGFYRNVLPVLSEAITLPGMSPDSKRAAKNITQKAIAEAKGFGVDVLSSDVVKPKTALGKIAQSATEKMIGGSGAKRAAQQGQRMKAAKDVAMQFGAAEDAANIFEDVYQKMKDKRGFKLEKYTELKKDVINRLNDRGAVPVDNTVRKIDKHINTLQAQSPSGENDALIGQLENFKKDIQNQGLVNIEAARKRLGDRFAKDPSLAHVKSQSEKITPDIYGQLNEDMGDFIKATGEKKDYAKWKAGNNKLRQMNVELQKRALKSTLKDGEATPETVRKLLFSNKPSDIKALYKALPPAGRRYAKTAIIQEAVDKSGGLMELSPDRFKNNLNRLSKQTGVFFSGQDKQVIDGIRRVLKLTDQAGKAGAAPLTGMQNLPILTHAIAGGVGASLAGPVGAIAAPVAIGTASKIYESKPIRNLLIRITESPPGSLREAEYLKRLNAALTIYAERQSKQQESSQ